MRRVQVVFAKNLGAAEREEWKGQSGFSILSDGVSPGRPDDIRPFRPFGRMFHAKHEISGLITGGVGGQGAWGDGGGEG